MKRIEGTEQVTLGQHVVHDDKVYVVNGVTQSALRMFPLGGDALEDARWVDVKAYRVFSDVDTDEDRQYVHDRLEEQRAYEQELHEVDDRRNAEAHEEPEGDCVVVGSVGSVRDALTAIRDGASSMVSGAGPAARLLEESLEILAERGRRYDNERGSPSITTTARLWDAYLDGFAEKGGPLTEVEVCEMIALHKVARRLQDRAGRDHHLDMINYLALAGAFAREDLG